MDGHVPLFCQEAFGRLRAGEAGTAGGAAQACRAVLDALLPCEAALRA